MGPRALLRAARIRGTAATLALALALLVGGAPGRPASACALALVAALDTSTSVNDSEFKLQLQGLAWALRQDEVREAILRADGVLMSAFEWSGGHQQAIIVDWSYLDEEAAIDGFARHIEAHRRAFLSFPTAIGYALGFAATRLSHAPFACDRKVVDVSGDGVLNDGFPPAIAYRQFPFDGVTVNGLVIKGAVPDPEPYYRREVLRGPGAFLVTAQKYADYGEAMKRKLLREIGNPVISQR